MQKHIRDKTNKKPFFPGYISDRPNMEKNHVLCLDAFPKILYHHKEIRRMHR